MVVKGKDRPTVASPVTLAGEAGPRPESDQQAASEHLYLIGRPPARQLLRFVRSHAVTPPTEGELVDAWRAANEVVRRLEQDEAGLADDPPIGKLGSEYEPLLREFLNDPMVRNSYNTVPTDVALVELDRLVVYQKHIDLGFVRQLEGRLGAEGAGPALTNERIFRTCLLHDHSDPPAKWSRVHQDKFVFMSPSNDLRYLGIMPLGPNHIKDYPLRGNTVGIVGIAVGFGSNFLNAVYAERRLILNNGSHRAYALRDLGVTHVPCIIQHASSRDEVELVAPSEVRRDPDLYLKHPRPPMLKDYFNPALRIVLPTYRRLRQVTVRFEVDENSVPGM